MKKLLSLLVAGALLAGCSSTTDTEDKTIRIGATQVPHAEILEDVVKPILEEEGWDVDITVFTDYIQPNTGVEEGSLDANYYQTLDYMNTQNEEGGLHLVAVAGIHLEPMSCYSSKYTSVDEIPDGAKISIPNDASNGSRALKLLAANGLITLKEKDGLYTVLDIAENPHNYEIVELEAAQLPRSLDDVDASVINVNYALQAELNPVDALFTEDATSEESADYVNYLVVKEGNEETEKTKALIEAMTSEEVRSYIEKTYGGSVLAAF
ncbi:MetQ/NlpA family ABC transporter substrate-binding protein [uncultured Traorella sp.]|jgi:D-methionine transport system substrate-binding protein|uniref:MetQ/NlpA family ABC transporter substrate-binding protein n=1 Tax=uncultured Traorella sp. TaxID=1929048 RepID=UPI0025D9EFCA|nr:MetQ/NlpA family ABC transporter substrate-binding protein [uncultured Traorella sp.]